MSAAATCKHCGCSEIDSDPSRGNAVCTNCGAVLEESIIVSEVTFEEDGHGGASAVGQFVAADSRGGGGFSGPGGFHQGFGKESREQTLRQAKRKIEEVAGNLRLNQHHVEVAHNFFKMALHKQLTKGRKNLLTIAACVYITCRLENTPHLLIDFSDVVQMDVYSLGRAYLQLSRALFVNIPAADPCLYILRFAHNFNLGDKTQTVANTAMRLIERMKKDWIHLGRRPSGLCGAALLIAARLHDFKRTVQDIIQIVKVHETTLRKRLVEFGETPSSALTMEEFMQVDLEEQHDPPSFKAAREKDKLEMQRIFEDKEYNKELTQLRNQIDEELDKRQAKALEKAEMLKNLGEAAIEGGREDEDTSRFITESTLSTITEIFERDETDATSVKIVEENRVYHVLSPVKSDDNIAAETCDKDRMLMPPPDRRPSQEELEAAGIGIIEKVGEKAEEESLEDIDDEEIDSYLMNEYEVRSKTKLWEELNKEYLEQQELKRAQKKLTPKEAKAEKQKLKKKGNHKQAETSSIVHQAANAGDAVMILLKERSQSSKINYDVLKNLGSYNIFDHAPTPSPMPTPSPGFIQKDDEDTKNFITIGSGAIVAKRRSSQISEGPGSPMKKSKSRKPRVNDVKSEPSGSITKVELQLRHGEISLSAFGRAEVEDDVVVETGPVAYDAAASYAESDEEEDHNVSASQLLNRFRGEDDYDEFDDYD